MSRELCCIMWLRLKDALTRGLCLLILFAIAFCFCGEDIICFLLNPVGNFIIIIDKREWRARAV